MYRHDSVEMDVIHHPHRVNQKLRRFPHRICINLSVVIRRFNAIAAHQHIAEGVQHRSPVGGQFGERCGCCGGELLQGAGVDFGESGGGRRGKSVGCDIKGEVSKHNWQRSLCCEPDGHAVKDIVPRRHQFIKALDIQTEFKTVTHVSRLNKGVNQCCNGRRQALENLRNNIISDDIFLP
jgi:hypothetical protein